MWEHVFDEKPPKGSHMDRESLELLLGHGQSIERIAKRFGKDPSTVSYWMAKYGLEAVNREKHAAKGGIERERLRALLDSGASIATISETLKRNPGTIRHWLARYELETRPTTERRIAKAARDAGCAFVQRHCRHHGLTNFWLEGRGAYRCLRCRQEAVVRRGARSRRSSCKKPVARARFAGTPLTSAGFTSITASARRRALR